MEIPVSEMKRRMRNKSQMKEDEPMIGNPADEISQSEKRRILAEDRKARSTYFQHAQSVIDEDRGGRFSAVGSSPAVKDWPGDRPKQEQWHDIPRMGRLARVMYPNLAEAEMQRLMSQLAANEQKTDPLTAKVRADQTRREQARTKRR
jgi:hypothetical protein